MKYLTVAFLWAAYCALHSYLISIRFTDTMKRLLKKYFAFYRLFFVVVSVLLLVPLLTYTAQLESREIAALAGPFPIIRAVVVWGSLLMFFWAFFFDYDPLHFFGIRQLMHMNDADADPPPADIKKNGLLGVVRHPMYLTLILILVFQTRTDVEAAVNAVLIVYTIIGTLLEEKKLVLEFGDAYVRYQQEVPMLVPFAKKVK